MVYQAICKAAGLNVIFDPEYVPKRIPVDLNDVSLEEALHIVGLLSGTFWKPVTSNTIFVAQNTRAKRTELDDLAVQTFYLTNVSQQNDANEIMVAIRNLLDPGLKIYLVASQNALIMRGTPDELILAEKIINDLDRTKPEVVVDVAELEVSRQLERNLGITLPTSFGLTPQYSNANISTSSTTTTTGTSTTTTSGLTLNTLGELECDELCGDGWRRHGECAAVGFGHAHSAEPAHTGDRWAAFDAEDWIEDSDCDGIVLGAARRLRRRRWACRRSSRIWMWA